MAVLQSSQITGKFAVTGSRDQTLVLKDYDTTQRNSLQAAAGAMIFNNTTSGVEFYTGNAWSSAIGRTGQTGLTGAKGGTGNQGAKGPTGADSNQAGAKGPDGAKGPTGAAGHQGFHGAPGNAGAQGPQGPRDGTKGPTGVQGVQGATGPANNQGGAQGVQGAKGPTGATGFQGFQGAKGPTGNQGPQGPRQGAKGPQGAQGPRSGAKGAQGVMGSTGNQGPQGIQGSTGPKGAQGNQGPKGPQGPSSTNQSMSGGDAPSFLRFAINSNSWPSSGRFHVARAVTDAVIFANSTPNGLRVDGGGNGSNIIQCLGPIPSPANRHWVTNIGQYYHSGNRSSDARIKKDIEEYSGSILNNINDFKPKTFLWNTAPDNDVSHQRLGFIAQDYTASKFSELVDRGELKPGETKSTDQKITDGNKEYSGSLGFNYDGAAAILIKAVSESKAILDDLNARVTTLEG
tara:strand:- start:338 stop:1711 length:1374 start_codon:yes stop_codon:yes gene_type:complete